jgi:hypothetical protein
MTRDQLTRTATLIGLLALALVVIVVGIFAVLNPQPCRQSATSPTAKSASYPTVPTFTPSPSLPGTDWTEYRGNTEATGVSADLFITASNVSNLTEKGL